MNPDQTPTPTPQPTSPDQPPVQPSMPAPTPEPVATVVEPQPQPAFSQPEPVTPTPTPTESPFGQPEAVAPQAPAPTASPFGSAIGSVSSDPTTSDVPTGKKPLNKKLIIIIAAAVVVVGIVIAAILLLPGIAKNASNSLTGSSTSNGKSLVAYEGTGYSISLPENFKLAPSKSTSTSSTIEKFTKGGVEANDETLIVYVLVSPFTATSTRDQSINFLGGLDGQTIPDTDTVKDNKSVGTKVAGFDALEASATKVKDGAEVAKSKGLYVFGNKNMYAISVTGPVSEFNALDVDAILNSFKPGE